MKTKFALIPSYDCVYQAIAQIFLYPFFIPPIFKLAPSFYFKAYNLDQERKISKFPTPNSKMSVSSTVRTVSNEA